MLWFTPQRKLGEPHLDSSWMTQTQKMCTISTLHLPGSRRPDWRWSAACPLDVYSVDAGSLASSSLSYTSLPAPPCSSRPSLGIHTHVTHSSPGSGMATLSCVLKRNYSSCPPGAGEGKAQTPTVKALLMCSSIEVVDES